MTVSLWNTGGTVPVLARCTRTGIAQREPSHQLEVGECEEFLVVRVHVRVPVRRNEVCTVGATVLFTIPTVQFPMGQYVLHVARLRCQLFICSGSLQVVLACCTKTAYLLVHALTRLSALSNGRSCTGTTVPVRTCSL